MLPNFLCIGAQKSGTTAIARWLKGQPGVFMPPAVETRFFMDDGLYELGISYYEMNVFRDWNGEGVVGEKTPEYLLFDDTPERVMRYLGRDVRLIVCLRHPLRRALSQYRHNLANGIENLPFLEALRVEPDRIGSNIAKTAYFGYAHRGRYAERLKPWLDTFPLENFLFIDFEELVTQDGGRRVQERLAKHLGMDNPLIDSFPQSGNNVIPSWHISSEMIMQSNAPNNVAKNPSIILCNFAHQAAQLLSPTLSDSEVVDLTEHYWPQGANKLRKLINLELTSWPVSV